MAKNYSELHNQITSRPGATGRLATLRESTLAEISLYNLRQATGVTQTELAASLNISQSAISQLEQGRDVKLSTLAAYINALGAELEITAIFNPGQKNEIKTPINVAAT